jgi:tetratricopeptide (TPR) repeat protein
MKPFRPALAFLLAASSTAAAAQYYGTMPQTDHKDQDQQSQQAAQKATGPQPSAKAQKAIIDLQTAVNANDVANIPAKLAAARAVATTPADHYWIAQLQLRTAAKANDAAAAAAAVDALAGTNLMPAAELAQLYGAVGGTYYKAKQYDQAVAAYQRQHQLAPQNVDAMTMIAEARAAQGRPADAVSMLQQAIQASSTGGRKADEAMYKRAVAIAYENKLPNALDLARQWVTAYPSDSSLRDTIAIYRNLHPGDSPNLIDIMRLARATNALQQASDYEIYAAKAADSANFGEAKSVVDEGIAAGKLKATDSNIAAIIAATKGKVPTAAQLAAAEKGAAIPTAYLRVGDRYYGAGDYAKAAALYREALSKGADANLANLRLGEALARSGDKAGAAAALKAVTGAQAEIAQLWLLSLQRA